MEGFQKMMTAAATGTNRVISGAVVMAADVKNEFEYQKSFGRVSTKDGAQPIDPDTVMWVASCTKLMTTVAALQCVQRGLLLLDEDVSRILPEWKDPVILTGFDESTGEPLLQKTNKHITLRQLLSHSSGMVYDGLNPLLQDLRKHQGSELRWLMGDIMSDLYTPLAFEPGDKFDYGPGIDWAGQMIERVNGNVRLSDYLSENIWKPLGMTSSTFRLLERPDLAARLAPMTARSHTTGELFSDSPLPFPVRNPKDDQGGAGLYTTPADYLKFLTSLLKNDGKLLHPETCDEMFRSQLSPDTTLLLQREGLTNPANSMFWIPGLPIDRDWAFGLGGIVARNGVPGRASEGAMYWGGLPNLQWWIDPKEGTCGMYASQLVPAGDVQSAQLFGAFQKAVFASYVAEKTNIA